MVHVRKCPLVDKEPYYQRGRSTTEFYKNGQPQIYCYGWIDNMTEDPIDQCRNCKDWVYGEQIEKDFEEISKQ